MESGEIRPLFKVREGNTIWRRVAEEKNNNKKHFAMGNYDSDYDDENGEYDPEEDIDMMFDEEDKEELYGE